jgi:alanine racemase
MSNSIHPTWLEIDLSSIRNNICQLQKISGTPVMAVIKANAYGHGIVETARTAEKAGVKWLGVARLDEAVQLRQQGIKTDILILGHTIPEGVKIAANLNICVTIHNIETYNLYNDLAGQISTPLRAHLKIDSGMGRLGFFDQESIRFLQEICQHSKIQIEGIFTHLAKADEPAAGTTELQLLNFNQILENLEEQNCHFQWVHAANSAASIIFPKSRYNLIRPGIAIYGLNPSEGVPVPPEFKAALSWKTTITSVKNMPGGTGISYGHKYFTRATERIGVISAGYGDGFRRIPDNEVLIHGKRVSVIGTVCMDQCMILLDEAEKAKPGDEVVLIGRQGEAEIKAEEVAGRWGTIAYEVTCGLAARIPRIYINP